MGTLEEAFEEGRRLLREATANKWSIHLSKNIFEIYNRYTAINQNSMVR